MTKPDSRQPISDDDVELLSAYIDNQLSAAERLTFERRLDREPHLRRELAELRATATLLRELPDISPSRSFTLDLAALPRQRRSLFVPLRWATLATTILLLFALTPDALRALREDGPLAPAPMAQQAPGSSANGRGGAADTVLMATAAPSAEEAVREAAQPTAVASSPQDTASNVQEAPLSTAAALPGGAGGPPEIDKALPYAPPLQAPPAESIQEPQSSSPGTAEFEAQAAEAAPAPLPWWRWLQIVLVAGLVALATATLWARMRER
jgi:hypothetical protein